MLNYRNYYKEFFFLLLIFNFFLFFLNGKTFIEFNSQSNKLLNASFYIEKNGNLSEYNKIEFFINKGFNKNKINISIFNENITFIRFDPEISNKEFELELSDFKIYKKNFINETRLNYSFGNEKNLDYEEKKDLYLLKNLTNDNDPYIFLYFNQNKNKKIIILKYILNIFFIYFFIINFFKFKYVFKDLIIFSLISLFIIILCNNYLDLKELPKYLILGPDYISEQAKSFLNFKYDLNVKNDPRLSMLNNPYKDFLGTDIHVVHDLSYFKNLYYFYWGLLPPILIAFVYSFLQIDFFISDKLIFIFSLPLYFYSLNILLNNLFIKTNIFFKLILFFNPPIVFCLKQIVGLEQGVYQVNYLFSQIAINFLIIYLFNEDKKNYSPILVGLLIGIVFFSRSSLIFTSVLFWFFFINKIFILNFSFLRKFFLISFFPIVMGIFQIYSNYIRFGSIFEFGQKYQLGILSRTPEDVSILSFKHYFFNLFKYIIKFPQFDVNIFFIKFNKIYDEFTIWYIEKFYNENEKNFLSINEPTIGIIFFLLPMIIIIILNLNSLCIKPSLREKFAKLSVLFFVSSLLPFLVIYGSQRYMMDFYIFFYLLIFLIFNELRLKNKNIYLIFTFFIHLTSCLFLKI